ncbi:hypothetical protein SF1_18370 [Sphingobacterium faecium NBRC 15299]|uniref:restriction endonuclease n=1 Tax=Sphingobacterium faecium TaxID=34087 RepID=UPI000D37D5AC|nr:restriction endonuclease [Sphingobacterium faecium]PTX09525.1 restriction endonuclease [Sphingobacterium faecium]GEM63855.1 hypothetical protein SF1_18370 [Sphingobacterium faecium NBRC 15299]
MLDESALDWEEYERITKYIYQSLGANYGIKVIGYGRDNNLKGSSGVKHQIDVMTEQFLGGKRLLTAIECKYWNRKVNKDVIMKHLEIMQDLEIENGIIVCKSGFTKDTVTYAEHRGIKLVILREVEEDENEHGTEIELGTIELKIHSTITRANITSINFGKKAVHFDPSIGAVYYWKLHNASGNEYPLKPLLFAYGDKVRRQNEPLKNITIDFPIDDGWLINIGEEEIEVEKLAVTGFLLIKDSNNVKSFTLSDQVWMVMEELFDVRRLSMSKSGLIWNLPKKTN